MSAHPTRPAGPAVPIGAAATVLASQLSTYAAEYDRVAAELDEVGGSHAGAVALELRRDARQLRAIRDQLADPTPTNIATAASYVQAAAHELERMNPQ